MGAIKIKEELFHFIEIADTRLLKVLYTIAKEYTKEDFTLSGKPMSEETLKNRIREAKSRIKDGQFTTHENLEKEMKEW